MIVDASVAVHWFVETPFSAAAAPYRREQIEVPGLFFGEVGHALSKYVRAGFVGEGEAVAAIEALAYPLVRVAGDRELAPEALRLCFSLNHPVYDCLYLALARRRDAVLVTADRKLAQAARGIAVDVRLLEPQAPLT